MESDEKKIGSKTGVKERSTTNSDKAKVDSICILLLSIYVCMT